MKRVIVLAVGLVLVIAETSSAKVVWLTTAGGKHKVRGIRAAAPPLPDSLVVEPGLYKIGRYAYRLGPGGNRTPKGYRIAFDGARSVISAVMWQTEQRKAADDVMWPETSDLANALMYRKLDISCGVSSGLTEYLLEIQGIPARRVGLVPEAADLDPVNDGHTLLEVYFDGQWQTVDPDADLRPLYKGRPITAQNYPRRERKLTFDWLSGDTSHPKTFYPHMLRQMGTAVIEHEGSFYFTDPIAGHTAVDLIAFRNGWYQYLPRPVFFALFYP